MTAPPEIDVSSLDTYALGPKSPLWWGQALMMVIEGSVIALLIASYFYVRVGFDVWPNPDVDRMPMLLPTLSLLVLLLSVPPMRIAGIGTERKNRRMVVWGTAANLACVVVFLLLRWAELVRFNVKWSEDIFGSFAWCLVGLHTMHAIADGIQTAVVFAIVLLKKVNEKQLTGLMADGQYWYFVVGIYIPIYITVFLYPAMLKGWRW